MRLGVVTKENQLSEIYSKHPNGGGKIGRFVTVSPDAFIGKGATVDGHAELYGNPKITGNSHIGDWCRVSHNVEISDSELLQFTMVTGPTTIRSSRLDGDAWVANSFMQDCDLRASQGQQIRVVDNSELHSVSGVGPIFVSAAKVHNCELLPLVRILGGEWFASPRIRRSPFQFHLIESHIEDNLLIGCWDRPLTTWKSMVSIYRRFGDRIATAGEAIQWDGGEVLGGFEKLPPEELSWYADAIENWSTE